MKAAAGSEIDGVWEMIRAECDGEVAPELVVRNTSLELARGEYRVLFTGETAATGTFEIDGDSAVKTILLRGVEGSNAGRTIPGIYQLTGNRLRICYGLDGVTPTELKTSGLNARYLAMYRRRSEKSELGNRHEGPRG
jgi:uncharacterized protein (TIGR03067 family)